LSELYAHLLFTRWRTAEAGHFSEVTGLFFHSQQRGNTMRTHLFKIALAVDIEKSVPIMQSDTNERWQM